MVERNSTRSLTAEVKGNQNTERSEKTYIVLTGATTRNKGVQQIWGTLRESFPRVRVYNSGLRLGRRGETPSPKRYTEMAGFVKNELNEGRTVTFFVHSYGAVELHAIVQEIKKTDPDYIKNHGKQLHIIFDSPTGLFRGFGGNYLRNYFRYLRKEEGVFGKGLMGAVAGVASLHTIPVPMVNNERLIQGIRKSLPRRTQYQPEIPQIAYSADRNYYPYLTYWERNKMHSIDTQIANEINKDIPRARRVKSLLRWRARTSKRVVDNAIGGRYARSTDPELRPTNYRWTPEAKRKRRQLLIDALLRGKVFNTIEELYKHANTGFAIPEYDPLIPDTKKRIGGLLGDQARIAIVPLGTHKGPLNAQPEAIVSIIKHFEQVPSATKSMHTPGTAIAVYPRAA